MISKNKSHESGQSLLVIVLLISVVFVLIATASYRLTTETQSSKAQEENIRVLAAADSGIEKGIDEYESGGFGAATSLTYEQLDIDLNGIDPVRSTVKIETNGGSSFESNVVRANDQYVFYLSPYDMDTATWGTSYTGRVTVYFGSGSAGACAVAGRTAPAVEMTILYGDGSNILRRFVDPCDDNPDPTIQKISTATVNNVDDVNPLAVTPIAGGTQYFYQFQINSLASATPDAKMIIFRPLFAGTRFAVLPQAAQPPLPIQGTNIVAEAYAISGVSKIVKLFQPNPQIPVDFFVTTF